MSNINKQACEKLKAAAAKANDEFDPNMFVMTRDILALLNELEAAEKTSEARRAAILRTHKMFQKQRDRAAAAEKRIADHDRKCDEQYLLGMLAGWNFGLVEDSDGYAAAYNSRRKLIEAAGIITRIEE